MGIESAVKIQDITVRQAYILLEEGALLVDVREACVCQNLAFAIENQISLDKLLALAPDHLDANVKLIFANLDGNGKEQLTAYTTVFGARYLYWLAGGLLQWRHEGFPVKGTLIDRITEHGENSCRCFSCCGN